MRRIAKAFFWTTTAEILLATEWEGNGCYVDFAPGQETLDQLPPGRMIKRRVDEVAPDVIV